MMTWTSARETSRFYRNPIRTQRHLPVAVTFADLFLAFLANPANQGTFAGTIGLAAFASASFTRRYGKDGFQVNGVTLAAPTDLCVQEGFFGETRLTGFREQRSERPERKWYEMRISRNEPAWIDASFSVPAKFAIKAVPGSIQIGQGGELVNAGISEPSPLTHMLKFQLPVMTDGFTVDYDLKAFVFAASDPSPVADLRRIQSLRRLLEDDPQFLVTLDGSPDQTPYIFIQLYKSGALQGTGLTEAAAVQAFAAADVLAAFMTIPPM
jgi:hypothetical protein